MNETQKLAEFLRTRCLRGLYGLRFIDVEQTILYIPWANVPRPNEELPAEFEMFRVSLNKLLIKTRIQRAIHFWFLKVMT